MDKRLSPKTLERYMRIAQELKKDFSYESYAEKWIWYDRNNWSNQSEPFNSFWEALCDAVSSRVERKPPEPDYNYPPGPPPTPGEMD